MCRTTDEYNMQSDPEIDVTMYGTRLNKMNATQYDKDERRRLLWKRTRIPVCVTRCVNIVNKHDGRELIIICRAV